NVQICRTEYPLRRCPAEYAVWCIEPGMGKAQIALAAAKRVARNCKSCIPPVVCADIPMPAGIIVQYSVRSERCGAGNRSRVQSVEIQSGQPAGCPCPVQHDDLVIEVAGDRPAIREVFVNPY